jgi:hypothetical protein
MPGDSGNGLARPGVLGRATGSCIAVGYVMGRRPRNPRWTPSKSSWKPITTATPQGWTTPRRRLSAGIQGDRLQPGAGEAIRDLVDFADRHSSLLGSFDRALPVTRELQITAPARK